MPKKFRASPLQSEINLEPSLLPIEKGKISPPLFCLKNKSWKILQPKSCDAYNFGEIDFQWSSRSARAKKKHSSEKSLFLITWNYNTEANNSHQTKGSSVNYDYLAISLVVSNVIPILIGPLIWALETSTMHHVGEGTWPCPFPVTGNGYGRITEPKGDHFSGRNLGMIP